MIAVLTVYIVYKSGKILAENKAAPVSGTGEVQRTLEDAAVRTLAPGYAAAVENRGRGGWTAGFMAPLAPVYSYMAEAGNGSGQAVSDGTENGSAQAASIDGTGGTGVDRPPQGLADETGDAETGNDSGQAASTNGVGNDSGQAASTNGAGNGSGQAASIDGTGGTGADRPTQEQAIEAFAGRTGISQELLRQLEDFDYLLSNYYTLDEDTSADKELFDARALLSKDLGIRKNEDAPQILVYHTHSQEFFADSVKGDEATSIVGMGEVLAEILRKKYGYQVIHDTGVYDLVDGVLDRSAAYDYARVAVEQILEENPTVEVIIDLHRDGVDGSKFVTEIDGKPTSRIMFFNGLSRNGYGEPLTWLENPCLEDNLAFSLQLQLLAERQYPGFTRNIYLKAERFNLHLRPRSLLVEAGTQLNTMEEERNAMEPLAALLAQVLGGAGER